MPPPGRETPVHGLRGRVANGINTVHLSCVREKNGPRADRRAAMGSGRGHRRPGAVPGHGPPAGPAVPHQGPAGHRRPGRRLRRRAGLRLRLRERGLRQLHQAAGVPLEDRGQASVLRVASSYLFALAPGTRMTSADVVKKHAKGSRGWEVRSVGQGSKGERWYAWAWIAAASPRHSLLVRRHLKTGELAFHYCYVPEGQAAAKARLIRAAGSDGRSRKFPVREGLLRPGPVPGQALHHDPAARRAGHGRPRGLRGHPRPAAGPHRCRGTAATGLDDKRRRTLPDPAHRPRGQATARRHPPAVQSHPATPPAGSSGDAATRHDPDSSTNAHAWHVTMPWPASNWLLPVLTAPTGQSRWAVTDANAPSRHEDREPVPISRASTVQEQPRGHWRRELQPGLWVANRKASLQARE